MTASMKMQANVDVDILSHFSTTQSDASDSSNAAPNLSDSGPMSMEHAVSSYAAPNLSDSGVMSMDHNGSASFIQQQSSDSLEQQVNDEQELEDEEAWSGSGSGSETLDEENEYECNVTVKQTQNT